MESSASTFAELQDVSVWDPCSRLRGVRLCSVSRLVLWVGFRGDTFSLFAVPLIMEVISRIIDTARENRQFLFQFSHK